MRIRLMERIDELSIWTNTTIKTLGIVELVFGLLLLIPTLVAILLHEDPMLFYPFAVILFVFGSIQFILFKSSDRLSPTTGLLVVTLTWVILFIIVAVPYMLAGMDPLNAMFESVSGLTTTGSTIMVDVGDWSFSLLVWRSLSQWIGGLTVILIFLYILPMFGIGRQFFTNELAGSSSDSFSLNISTAALSFMSLYTIFTALNFIALIIVGMDPYEALCLSFTTVSTGGMMCTNNSLTDYSIAIQIITMIFMFIGGINFYLHFKAFILKKKGIYRKNSELRGLLIWFIIIIAMLSTVIYVNFDVTYSTFKEYAISFKDIVFTTLSLGTSSGFYTADYDSFTSGYTLILIVLCLVGASSGSTSGGMKIGRIVLTLKLMRNSMKKYMHPNSVPVIKMDGEPVNNEIATNALVVIAVYLITIFFATLLLSLMQMTPSDALGLAVTTLTNVGSGFGSYGPTECMYYASSAVKILTMILMWIGRLEIIVALIIFTPGFWGDVLRERKKNRKFKAMIRSMRER